MLYQNIVEGRFINRPNRFIAHVMIDGNEEICHVKNTGRCKELLIPGTKVYLERNYNTNRKTKYSLITVEKNNRLINMDSNAPNKVVHEWLKEGVLFQDISLIRPETKYNNSRFDFYIEHGDKKVFIEVKGVTLEEDGVVRFPDAPTIRGLKHVYELCDAKREGYEAYVIFVIQMKDVKYFTANIITHKEFGDALIEAKNAGVQILAYDCDVTKDYLKIVDEVEVRL